MAFEFAGSTDVGRKREHNEDSLLLLSGQQLMVVADGMGGHNAGEVASALAVSTVEWFFTATAADPEATWPYRMDRRYDDDANRVLVSIQLANGRIREAAKEESKQGMGTTIVAALLVGSHAYVAWVGDSRGYLYRDGTLFPLTTDHSLQNELLRTGQIRPEDLATFQHKNVITRALGINDKVEVDLQRVELAPDDVVLICCDGLTTMLEDGQIADILAGDSELHAASQKLIDGANAAGGNDNVTVALARYKPEPAAAAV